MNDSIDHPYVLVTTAHRGVFAGELIDDQGKAQVTLRNARNCIYWASTVGGFLGLAKAGPNSDCRIGSPADAITLYDITSCAPCSGEAAKAWKDARVHA